MYKNIDLRRLKPHPNNPRGNLGDLSELAESIKARGIMQNLTVVPEDVDKYLRAVSSKHAYTGDYTIIIGHRRAAASNIAGLTEVMCKIETDMDERTQVGTMLLENIQRTDLTLLEEAQGMQMMLDFGDSIKDISEKTGLSETTVRRRVKIVKTFGKEAIERVQDRTIEIGDYEKIYKVENPERQAVVFDHIGTREFDWALEGALREQAKDAQREQLVGIISKFAAESNPTHYREARTAHYWNYYRLDTGDLEAVQKLEGEAKTVHADKEFFYFAGGNHTGVTVYAIGENTDKETDAENVAERVKAEEKEARVARIKGMFKQAYELRISFAKRYNALSSPETKEAVINIATTAVIGRQTVADDVVREMFDIKEKFRQTHEKGDGETREEAVSRVLQECATASNNITILFRAAYCRIEPGNIAALDYYGNYSHKESLESVYEHLISLGYSISEEENKLVNGTHPIYIEGAE